MTVFLTFTIKDWKKLLVKRKYSDTYEYVGYTCMVYIHSDVTRSYGPKKEEVDTSVFNSIRN